ncbi:conserved hypothetical protein [Candidatus Magnetomoraceae bacterium gMMP-15]
MNPLLKRIKRQIIGKPKEFFIPVSPGLKKLCYNEFNLLPLSSHEAEIVKGGIEFKAKVHDSYIANLRLCTANRILMRIGEFKATNFRQLEKKLNDLAWELFLFSNSPLSINVSTHHSRLYHKEAIKDKFKAVINDRFLKAGLENKEASLFKQEIFVRAFDDHLTVSIDSSGELLYKRGVKKYIGKAPIRESIASAILSFAKWNKKNELIIDPMCGSGTFSIEAAMKVKSIPPGWFRNFAFMGWPCFRHQRWSYIKKESEKLFKTLKRPVIFASDKDKKLCNLLEKTINKYNLSDAVRIFQKDFFNLSPGNKKGLVLINPPYGLRIGTKSTSKKFFDEIVNKLKKDYKGWKVAIIAPDQSLIKTLPFHHIRSHNIFHGGLNLSVIIGRI